MRASATPRKYAAMRWSTMPDERYPLEEPDELAYEEIDGAWDEEGSDQSMDFDVLVRVKQEALEMELRRERRIARRAE